MQQKNEDKNGQLVTSGIFYCRVSAEINGCGSLQTSSWFDSDVLRNRQQKHTADRYAQAEKKTATQQIDNENGILNLV